jgi:hypothetical protein
MHFCETPHPKEFFGTIANFHSFKSRLPESIKDSKQFTENPGLHKKQRGTKQKVISRACMSPYSLQKSIELSRVDEWQLLTNFRHQNTHILL